MPDNAGETARRDWPGEGGARVPYWVYHDQGNFENERDRIFRGPTWNYIALAAELPEVGDFRQSFIGDIPVLAVRGSDGAINVVQNRCAHRGSRLTGETLGNCGNALTCPYHQWTYDLEGALIGVPFRHGVKGKGGMPEDFDLADHGLVRLRAETLNGVVFASFDPKVAPLTDYLGPVMLHYFTRVFDGRPLRVLGYQRQLIGGNWKLMMENIKDPYHAGLLHVFLVSFGLFRVDQKSECLLDDSKGHAVMASRRAASDDHAGTDDVAKFDPDYTLEDTRLIMPAKEFPDDVTLAMLTVFPSLIVQQQTNTLAMRHVIPRGPDRFELSWTFFGYEGDDEEMTERRVRQANLMGCAGYVSLDDTEMMEFSRAGIAGTRDGEAAVLDLGGRDSEPGDHLVTEAAIRGFYERYRAIMDFANVG